MSQHQAGNRIQLFGAVDGEGGQVGIDRLVQDDELLGEVFGGEQNDRCDHSFNLAYSYKGVIYKR